MRALYGLELCPGRANAPGVQQAKILTIMVAKHELHGGRKLNAGD